MSGTYAAVIPLFDPFEDARPETAPTLDDTICYLRWRHPEMIETLDERMKKQQAMVLEILLSKGMSPRDLMKLSPQDAEGLDEVLRLCYHVLRDIAYIDNLR